MSTEATFLYNEALQRANNNDRLGAIACLLQVVSLNPRHSRAYSKLGSLYTNLHMHQEAATAYGAYVQLCPQDAMGYFQLGRTYLRLGQLGDAADISARLRSLDATKADALDGDIQQLQETIQN